jgi:integral membrane protein (TIGR01906 family)
VRVDRDQTPTYDTTNLAGQVLAGRLRPGRLAVGVFRVLATLLFIVSIPVALITSNVRFLANEPRVYRYAIDEYDAAVMTGIDREQLIRAGGEIRAYFNNDQDTLAIRVQQAGKDVSLFNPRETAHMKDVKNRFSLLNRVQEFSVLYALTYVAAVVLWAREISGRRLAVSVIVGCALTLLVIGGAGALGAAGFNSSWESFHRLIFNNDFWRLNPTTDHLIQMFPPRFWENIVFLVGLLVAAEAALLLFGAVIYLGIASRRSTSQRLEPFYA